MMKMDEERRYHLWFRLDLDFVGDKIKTLVKNAYCVIEI
jgi:hypothetical protein